MYLYIAAKEWTHLKANHCEYMFLHPDWLGHKRDVVLLSRYHYLSSLFLCYSKYLSALEMLDSKFSELTSKAFSMLATALILW